MSSALEFDESEEEVIAESGLKGFVKRFLDVNRYVLYVFAVGLMCGLAMYHFGFEIAWLMLSIFISVQMLNTFLLQSNKMLFVMTLVALFFGYYFYLGLSGEDEQYFYFGFAILWIFVFLYFVVQYIEAKRIELVFQKAREHEGFIGSQESIVTFDSSFHGRILQYIMSKALLVKFFNIQEYDYGWSGTMLKISDATVEKIVEIIVESGFDSVFYMGSANRNLVVTIGNTCSITLSDWHGVTRKTAHFFWEDDDPQPLPIPDWAIDVPVQVEGVPKHDIFLLDVLMKGNDYLNYVNQAKVVILFGEANFDEFTHKDLYEWSDGEILVGLLKNAQQAEQKHYEEKVIAGRKVLVHVDEENDSISISFAV
jgi:hypothetical protein